MIGAAREKTWRETERLLTREVVDKWRGRRLSEIKRADIHNLLDRIADRPAPVVAKKTFAALLGMGNWAVERGIVDVNPFAGIKAPAAPRPRDRVLNDAELAALWAAAEALGYPFGPLVQLLILTGQRLREVANASWSEIDLAGKTWTLPQQRSKNAKAHMVALSPQALAILESLPRIAGERGFVLTTNGRSPVSGFSKARARLGAALPGAPHWTFHDLRRSMATGLAALGVSIPVIEKVLHHVSGSFSGIVGVYQRHGYLDEQRSALALWGRHVEALAAGEASNVIPLAAVR
jgi:integrase